MLVSSMLHAQMFPRFNILDNILDVQLMQDELGIETDGPLLGRKYTF